MRRDVCETSAVFGFKDLMLRYIYALGNVHGKLVGCLEWERQLPYKIYVLDTHDVRFVCFVYIFVLFSQFSYICKIVVEKVRF